MQITQDTLRKIIREELESMDEERDLKSLWMDNVVGGVIGMMQRFGLHRGRPSTFLERHLEAAADLQKMMKFHNLSDEDLRVMMEYAKTLYDESGIKR
jgi:hypothetical protein